MSLREYHDVAVAANAVVAYTPFKQADRKFILTANLLYLSQIKLKIMHI